MIVPIQYSLQEDITEDFIEESRKALVPFSPAPDEIAVISVRRQASRDYVHVIESAPLGENETIRKSTVNADGFFCVQEIFTIRYAIWAVAGDPPPSATKTTWNVENAARSRLRDISQVLEYLWRSPMNLNPLWTKYGSRIQSMKYSAEGHTLQANPAGDITAVGLRQVTFDTSVR